MVESIRFEAKINVAESIRNNNSSNLIFRILYWLIKLPTSLLVAHVPVESVDGGEEKIREDEKIGPVRDIDEPFCLGIDRAVEGFLAPVDQSENDKDELINSYC